MISGALALKARWLRPGRRRDQRCSPKVFVIVPGLGLLGLSGPGRLGEVLAMTGGVVAMAGLVLLVRTQPTASTPGPTPGPWCCWPGPARDGGWWA
jgi:hypothetical protein